MLDPVYLDIQKRMYLFFFYMYKHIPVVMFITYVLLKVLRNVRRN